MNAIGQHCDLVYCVMSHFGKRRVGAPNKRWADSLDAFVIREWDCQKDFWKIAALCRDDWASIQEDLIKFNL